MKSKLGVQLANSMVLLNIKESTKVLSAVETRALIYQGILITTEIESKLQVMNALQNSFRNENIEGAFNLSLSAFLKNIEENKVPSNFTTFYQNNLGNEEIKQTNIKINNKILHQSKLINYLKVEKSKSDPTKDLNNFLKKIKKDKKYFFSKKDVILVETFKSDGIKILEKYSDIYQINDSEIPSDIQIFINSGDMAAALNILGFVSLEKEKYPEAKKYFSNALAIQPNFILAENNLMEVIKKEEAELKKEEATKSNSVKK